MTSELWLNEWVGLKQRSLFQWRLRTQSIISWICTVVNIQIFTCPPLLTVLWSYRLRLAIEKIPTKFQFSMSFSTRVINQYETYRPTKRMQCVTYPPVWGPQIIEQALENNRKKMYTNVLWQPSDNNVRCNTEARQMCLLYCSLTRRGMCIHPLTSWQPEMR